ncbi:accessory gene regulator B family protein [Enterococcus casseliflavus]
MEKSARIISSFVRRHDKSWDSSLEVLEYSITLLLESILVLSSFVIISLSQGKLAEGIQLIIVLVLVRNFFGGGHASKFTNCFIISNIAFLAAMHFITVIKDFSSVLVYSIAAITILAYTLKQRKIAKSLLFASLTILSTLMISESLSFGFFLITSCILTTLADLIFER